MISMFRCDLEENFDLGEGRKLTPSCANLAAVCPGVG